MASDLEQQLMSQSQEWESQGHGASAEAGGYEHGAPEADFYDSYGAGAAGREAAAGYGEEAGGYPAGAAGAQEYRKPMKIGRAFRTKDCRFVSGCAWGA